MKIFNEESGYQSLGISRSWAVENLLKRADDAIVRHLIAPEIEDAVINQKVSSNFYQQEDVEDLVEALKVYRETQKLFEATRLQFFQLLKINTTANPNSNRPNVKILQEKQSYDMVFEEPFKEQLKPFGLKEQSQLTKLQEKLIQARLALRHCCRSKNVFKAYVSRVIANPNFGLVCFGAINGQGAKTSSLDAIARIKGINIQVWSRSGVSKSWHLFKVSHNNPSPYILPLLYQAGQFRKVGVSTNSHFSSSSSSHSSSSASSSSNSSSSSSSNLTVPPKLIKISEEFEKHYHQQNSGKNQNSKKNQSEKNVFEIINPKNLNSEMNSHELDFLQTTIQAGDARTLLLFLENMISVVYCHLEEPTNISPLYRACLYNKRNLIPILCRYGASMAESTPKGTVLDFVVANDQAPLIRQFYQCGADIDSLITNNPTILKLRHEIQQIKAETIGFMTYRASLLAAHRAGFQVKFSTEVMAKEKISLFARCHPSTNVYTLTITLRDPLLKKKITLSQAFNLNDFTQPFMFSLDYPKCSLELDKEGILIFEGLETNADIHVNVQDKVAIKDVKTRGNICIERATASRLMGDVQANQFSSQVGLLINRGHLHAALIDIKRCPGTLEAFTLDNRKGKMTASQKLKIHAGYFANGEGVLRAHLIFVIVDARLDNTRGSMFSQERTHLYIRDKLNNLGGHIDSKIEIKIQGPLPYGTRRPFMRITKESLDGGNLIIDNKQGGCIIAGRFEPLSGKVDIKAQKIITDDASLIYGGDETIIEAREKIGQGSPLGGDVVSMTSDNIDLTVGVAPKLMVTLKQDGTRTLQLKKSKVKSFFVSIEAHQISYSQNTFEARDKLDISLRESQDILTPIRNAGSMTLQFSEKASRPIQILADISAAVETQPSTIRHSAGKEKSKNDEINNKNHADSKSYNNKGHADSKSKLDAQGKSKEKSAAEKIDNTQPKANMNTMSGRKKNSNVHIESIAQPIIIGRERDNIFVTIGASGSNTITAPAIDLVRGSLRSDSHISLSANHMKLGRLINSQKPLQMPSSILSAGSTYISIHSGSKETIEMEGLSLYSYKELAVRSQNPVDCLAVDMTTAESAVFHTPLIRLRQTFDAMGKPTSKHSRLQVGQDLQVTQEKVKGEMEVLGDSQVSFLSFDGKKIRSVETLEYVTETRSVQTGKKYISTFRLGSMSTGYHIDVYENRTFKNAIKAHSPKVSSGSKLKLEDKEIVIVGVYSVLEALIQGFDNLTIGRNTALILESPPPFKPFISLFEETEIDPLFRPCFNGSPIIMQPIIDLPMLVDLSLVVVLGEDNRGWS